MAEQPLLLGVDPRHRLEGVPLELRLVRDRRGDDRRAGVGEQDGVAVGRPADAYAAAAVPPAPGRFSTASGCGSAVRAPSASARAKTSAPPPGAKPTTKVIGRVGKSCAGAGHGPPATADRGERPLPPGSPRSTACPCRSPPCSSSDQAIAGRPAPARFAGGAERGQHAGVHEDAQRSEAERRRDRPGDEDRPAPVRDDQRPAELALRHDAQHHAEHHRRCREAVGAHPVAQHPEGERGPRVDDVDLAA